MKSVWQLGFRPFFLLAALHALVAVVAWISFLSGGIASLGHLDPIVWHGHEMIFGFAASVIAGFVLTAAQNWTGVRGVHGRPLQLLVALWVLGRLGVSLSVVPGELAAFLDLSFFPLLAFFLFPYLQHPELKVERVFYLFFALFFSGNLLVHFDALGILPGLGRTGLYLSLNTVILVIVFMGGRVIPFFTASELARNQPKTWPWVERASFITMCAFLVLDLFVPNSGVFALVALLTALTHLIRLSGWYVRRIRRIPLIWVLHAAYFWLVIGFFLTGLAALGVLTRSLATHAFTLGGLGIMIYGMITRVALGHTGRRLHPSASIVVGYVLLNVAAIARVFGPMIFPTHTLEMLTITAVFWCLAFLIYLVVYAPMLLSPRIDGRLG